MEQYILLTVPSSKAQIKWELTSNKSKIVSSDLQENIRNQTKSVFPKLSPAETKLY